MCRGEKIVAMGSLFPPSLIIMPGKSVIRKIIRTSDLFSPDLALSFNPCSAYCSAPVLALLPGSGAWIETTASTPRCRLPGCRSLRGGVDGQMNVTMGIRSSVSWDTIGLLLISETKKPPGCSPGGFSVPGCRRAPESGQGNYRLDREVCSAPISSSWVKKATWSQ